MGYQILPNATFFTIAITAIFSALVVTLLVAQPAVQLLNAWKIGQPLRHADAPKLQELHHHKKNTPTMGGVFLGAVFILLGVFFLDFSHISAPIILLTYLATALIGSVDDIQKLKGAGRGLCSRTKFLCQLFIACAIPLVIYFFDPSEFDFLFRNEGSSLLWTIPFFLFVFTGSSNAVNLTDGLDGLAASITAIVSIGLLAVLLPRVETVQDYNCTIALALMIGTAAGFLWLNDYPAKVFMGDSGSLSYGALFAVIAWMTRTEWVYALMGAVFVIEALSVIIQVASYRLRNGKRVFRCTPIHHHFQLSGYHENCIVSRMRLITVICVLLGLILWRS
jgi:phospho-N-acetylmuramoyl-pentapeptide-transferase